MKFSGKMYLKIILKVRKNRSLTLSLEDTFSKKTQEGRRGEGKLNPPPRPAGSFRVKATFTY